MTDRKAKKKTRKKSERLAGEEARRARSWREEGVEAASEGGRGERERERVRDKKKKRYEQRNERKARSLRSEKSTLGATCCDSSVGGTVNNCLHLDQCPGGVEPGASDGHTHTLKKHQKNT